MARVKTYQAAFVSGELSPMMIGRTDLESYGKGLAAARNVYILPQGGVFRREGLAQVDETTSSQAERQVSFEFNTEQTYLIVFTPGEMKVYRDNVLQATVSSAPISGLTAAILNEMNWTQSADTLILVHPDLRPIEITRSSHTVWAAANVSFMNIPTYDYGAGAEAVISATRGWPRAIAFKFGRLWLCGTKSRPQTLLASVVGDFYNYDVGTGLDDEAIDVTIDDDRVNAVVNVFAGRALQIYTTGGEFVIRSALDDPVTPGKIAQQLSKETLHGSSCARPVSVDGGTIFVEAGGRVVRRFAYNDLEQSFNAPNISLLSEHLIRTPVRMDVRHAVNALPADFVYLVNSDGTMAVLSILTSEKLLAWSLFETDGAFEDVCVVNDTTYVTVRRTINGATKRHIERMDAAYLLDCARQASITGFTNGDFSSGISGWTNKSTGTGAISHDAVNGTLVLDGNAAGVGWAEQAITTKAVVNTVRLDVSGTSIAYVVGTATGLSDIASGTLAAGDGRSFSFTPATPGTVYIGFKQSADAASSIDNVRASITSWAGFGHLDGETAFVLGDRYVLDPAVVASGSLTASEGVASVEVGLAFYAEAELLPVVILLNDQPTAGDYLRLVSVLLRLYQSRQVIVKVNGKVYRRPFQQFGNNVLDKVVALFDGYKEVFLGGIFRDCQVTITQDAPLEFNLLAAAVKVEV